MPPLLNVSRQLCQLTRPAAWVCAVKHVLMNDLSECKWKSWRSQPLGCCVRVCRTCRATAPHTGAVLQAVSLQEALHCTWTNCGTYSVGLQSTPCCPCTCCAGCAGGTSAFLRAGSSATHGEWQLLQQQLCSGRCQHLLLAGILDGEVSGGSSADAPLCAAQLLNAAAAAASCCSV